MVAARKREWQRPAVRPITTSDSRADVSDTVVRNLVSISPVEN
jgi:hypothetical protein